MKRRWSRHSFGVRNRAPWLRMFSHSLHQFHENDLFTSAAAMSYFGLITLFPALMLLFGERVWRTPAWLDRLLPAAKRPHSGVI